MPTRGVYCNSYSVTQNGVPITTGSEGCINVGGAKIGDTIFRDWDGDGTQDPGEEGMPGVTVELQNGTCTPGLNCPTLATDANGHYLFSGLTAGNYTVVVPTPGTDGVPGGYTVTADPNGAPYTTSFTYALSTDELYLGADWGYKPGGAGSIGDTVFDDKGNDGAFNPALGDVGIPNVTVWLYEDTNGNGVVDAGSDLLIATTSTDANGNYSFTGLAEGMSYVVDVDQTDNDLVNVYYGGSPFVPTTADPQSVPGLSGAYLFADFGFYEVVPGSIGDQLFVDSDHDGQYDAGEPGVPFVDVKLYQDTNGNGTLDAGEPLLATTTSAADGTYSFTDLPAGNYIVDVVESDADVPDGYVVGNDPAAVTLGVAQARTDVDFPFDSYLTKTVDKATANPGETLTYQLRPRYPRSDQLSSANVTDLIPTGTTYLAASVNAGGEALDNTEPPDGIIDEVAWDMGSTTGAVPGFSGGTALCPATLTLQGTTNSFDTWISEDGANNQDNNYGGDADFETANEALKDRSALLRFNAGNATLPTGWVLDRAVLKLTATGGSGANRQVEVRELNTAFEEGTGTGGDLCGVSSNGATWDDPNCLLAGTWAGGGDFGSSDYGATSLGSINPTDHTVTYAVSTSQLKAVVEGWLNGGTNKGFAVVGVGSANNAVTWASSENGTAANQPQLVLYYRSPQPSGCSGTFAVTALGDADIDEDNPTTWKGGDNAIKTQPSPVGKRRYGLIQFDVAGIPAGVQVTAATLSHRGLGQQDEAPGPAPRRGDALDRRHEQC